MPLDQTDLRDEIKQIFRIVGTDDGGKVRYGRMASALKQHAEELLAEGDAEGEGADDADDAKEATMRLSSPQRLEQAQASAKTSLQLELEALAAQAKEAARAAA